MSLADTTRLVLRNRFILTALVLAAWSAARPACADPVEQHADGYLEARVDDELEHPEQAEHRPGRAEAPLRLDSGDPERRALEDRDRVGEDAEGQDEPGPSRRGGGRHCSA